MNILHPLPSRETLRRHGAKVALVSSLGMVAACDLNTDVQPAPTPVQTTNTAHAGQIPSCTIDIDPAGKRTFQLGVNIRNGFKPNEYDVKNVSFYFGDGGKAEDLPTSNRVLHTYVQPGVVTVRAAVNLDITPAADLPFKQEDVVHCSPRPLIVK